MLPSPRVVPTISAQEDEWSVAELKMRQRADELGHPTDCDGKTPYGTYRYPLHQAASPMAHFFVSVFVCVARVVTSNRMGSEFQHVVDRMLETALQQSRVYSLFRCLFTSTLSHGSAHACADGHRRTTCPRSQTSNQSCALAAKAQRGLSFEQREW